MDLATIQDIFQQWVAELDQQGLSVRHTHSLSTAPSGLLVVTAVTGVRLDPERRSRVSGRQPTGDRPYARIQYLIAVAGDAEPLQAEQILLTLLMAADQHAEMQILPETVPSEWWLAQGSPPRPAFQVEVCVTRPGPAPDVPLVKDHSVEMEKLAVVHGQVVWSDGRPIAGAQVHLASSGQTVYSDSRGAFQLSLPDSALDHEAVRVQARDQVQTFSVTDIVTEDERWLLQMPQPEV